MKASKYLHRACIGQTLMTEPLGEYPGGPAQVVEILPDPNTPEIVFNVEHPTFGVIGVFDDEEVEILNE